MSHTTFEELNEKIIKWQKEIPVGSRWIHFKDEKSERPYRVMNLALEEASEEVVVVYRREDRPENFTRREAPLIWTRPVEGQKGWLSELEINGTKVKRFRKI